ncbi:MAG: polysaccharide pyruvyl transferase family protein [bacterium]
MDTKRAEDNTSLRILLVNLHSSRNAGDDALTQEALRQLRGQFPHAHFTLAMNDPDSYRRRDNALGSFTAWVKRVRDKSPSPWRWESLPGMLLQSTLALLGYRLTNRPWFAFVSQEHQALLEAYLSADMVISCAGNFLYSSGQVGMPFLLALFSIFYAWLAGKPLYTLPQTLGPLRRRWEHLLAKVVLSRVRLVLVRDPISLELWRSWKIRRTECVLLPDLAFAFDSHDVDAGKLEATALLRAYGVDTGRNGPLLGLTLVQWGAQNRDFSRQAIYEHAITAAIESFLRARGGRVFLFAQVHGPTQSEDDRIPAKRIRTKLGHLGDRVVLVDRIIAPHALKAVFGHMDLFLGTRLHSNIFALSEVVPVVAIAYQYKTHGIMQMLGLQQWVLDIENLDSERLIEHLDNAWEKRASIRAQIREALPGIRARASQAGALIASDFSSLLER